jgi:hypothetical protein
MDLMKRRYFVLDRPSVGELEALEACIGNNWTQRYSIDGSKIIIKTNQSIINSYFGGSVLKFGTEYTDLTELRNILSSDFWQIEDFIK